MAGVYRDRFVSQLTSVSRYKAIRSGRDSSVGTVTVRDVGEVFLIHPDRASSPFLPSVR